MKIKQYIPNILTIMNLVSGLISLIFTMQANFVSAAIFIFIAAVFDFLDGNTARILKSHSELGKQLDSLADMMSFGAAPGLMVFQLLSAHCEGSCNILERMHIIPYLALLIPVCSAIRLARFNIDLRQEVNFIGLPTPANAIFFASIPLVLYVQPDLFSLIHLEFLTAFFSNSRIITILVVFFSYLLISDFRIFSMKFKTPGWKGNQLQYSLLVISVILLLFFFLSAIPVIIILYVLMSIFFQNYITE